MLSNKVNRRQRDDDTTESPLGGPKLSNWLKPSKPTRGGKGGGKKK